MFEDGETLGIWRLCVYTVTIYGPRLSSVILWGGLGNNVPMFQSTNRNAMNPDGRNAIMQAMKLGVWLVRSFDTALRSSSLLQVFCDMLWLCSQIHYNVRLGAKLVFLPQNHLSVSLHLIPKYRLSLSHLCPKIDKLSKIPSTFCQFGIWN